MGVGAGDATASSGPSSSSSSSIGALTTGGLANWKRVGGDDAAFTASTVSAAGRGPTATNGEVRDVSAVGLAATNPPGAAGASWGSSSGSTDAASDGAGAPS